MDWIKFLISMLFLFVAYVCFSPGDVQAAVNADGSVTLNEENFPDAKFRYIVSKYDVDHDNALSLSERSMLKKLKLEYIDPVYYSDRNEYELIDTTLIGGPGTSAPENLEVGWRSEDSSTQKLSVKGIEYFPELQSYHVNGYMETEGSLRSNAKLTELSIGIDDYGGATSWPCKLADCSRLEQDFPMKQLKTIKIGPAFECRKFLLRTATELEELQIGVGWPSQIVDASSLGKVDLSANKELKKLWFHGVKVTRLDLRKNKKIKEIELGGTNYMYDYGKYGKKVDRLYTLVDDKCELMLPKKNQIKKLIFMTPNKKLDLTTCRKLTFLQVRGGVQLKMNRKWYDSYGKKKLALYARGIKQKKKIEKKTKKDVFLKTNNWFEFSPGNGYDQPYLHG